MNKTTQTKKTQDKTSQKKVNTKVTTTVAEDGQEIINASEAVKKAYETQKNSIIKCMDNVKGSYLKIGLALVKIHRGNMYVLDGYKNIADFAESVFSLPRATTNNSMNIVKKFCNPGTASLMDDFVGYNFTQLVEMIPMSDELLAQVDLTMSAAKMRELKKSVKEIESKQDAALEDHDSAEDVNTEQSAEPTKQESNCIEIKRVHIVNALTLLCILCNSDSSVDSDQLNLAKSLLDEFNKTQEIKIV